MYYNNYTYPNYSQYNNDINLIFVNGLEGVRGYRIRPQQTVLLVDSTQSRICLKSTYNLVIVATAMKEANIDIVIAENETEKANTKSVGYSREVVTLYQCHLVQ